MKVENLKKTLCEINARIVELKKIKDEDMVVLFEGNPPYPDDGLKYSFSYRERNITNVSRKITSLNGITLSAINKNLYEIRLGDYIPLDTV